ncbi:MAG: VOC family protein, partial [Pseudomonadota bacterium]
MSDDFQIGPLNHVGVAVPDLQDAMETYRTLYGATDITEPFDMPAQGVKVCFVNLPNSQIELIEPLNEQSPIHNFIQKNP